MKKLLPLLSLFLILYQKVSAQQLNLREIDSLQNELKLAREDTIKVQLLARMAINYRTADYKKAVYYMKQSIALAQKLQHKESLATCYYILGNIHSIHSGLNDALDCYRKTLIVLKEKNDKEGMATVLNNMAAIYQEYGNYPLAIATQLKSLKLFEETGNKNGMANSHINVGDIFLQKGDLEKAKYHFLQAQKLYEEYGNPTGQALALNNLGNNYSKTGDYATALDMFKRALILYQKNVYQPGIVMVLDNMAGCYSKFKQYKTALGYGYASLDSSRKYELVENLAAAYRMIGEIYFEMASDSTQQAVGKETSVQNLKFAKMYTDSAITVFAELGVIEDHAKALEMSAMIDEKMGRYKEAYDKARLFKILNDSAYNIEVDKKITQSAMQYDFDKKEAATKAAQEKKDLIQRNILYSVVAGLIGTFLFLLVVFRQRNRIKKEKQRSDELLLNILPAEVAEELKETGSAAARQFDLVTVMFTDFKGFTQISEKLSPAELVAEIDYCFKAFDHIVAKYDIEKIKTIGDAYMCAGGLPVSNTTHATDVVKAALDIQLFMHRHMEQRTEENKPVFEIRIGIHTGPVVAGIVGVKKFAYDVWGDTVNIASRMESSGEAGKINISASTFELVKQDFKCVYRGKINAKNKGEIDMYFVEESGL